MSTKIDSRQVELRSAQAMIGSSANDTLNTIFPKINDEIAKLFEDRNAILTGGGTITNTGGTSLSFTSNFVLYLNSNVAGAAPYTVSIGSSPWSFSADGNMAYIAITSRSAGTFTLTTDASSLPAVTSSGQEVFLIAKRVGTNIIFREGTIVNSGASITLGSANVNAAGVDGNVQFNSSGSLGGSSDLQWDNTNKRLLIADSTARSLGTVIPKLQISSTSSTERSASVIYYGNDSSSSMLALGKSRGATAGTHAVVQSGDGLASFAGYGSDGTSFIPAGSIAIVSDGTPGTNDMPGRIVFNTTADGASTLTERMRITNGGLFLAGDTTARSYGTLTPKLQISSTSSTERSISSSYYGNDTSGSVLALGKSRGTSVGTQTIVQSGDNLGSLVAYGSDGTNFITAGSITIASDGTPGTNDMPGRIVFNTTADGASSPTERMRIDNAGKVGIGTTPSYIFDLSYTAPASFTNAAADFLQMWKTGSTAAAGVAIETTGTTARFVTNNGYSFAWNSGTTQQMRLDSSTGYLGIGIAPSVALHVNNGSGARVRASGAVGSGFEFNDANTRITISAANTMSLYTSNTENMQISSTGNIVLGAQSILSTGATAGYVYIPFMNGLPGALPASTFSGKVPMVWDNSNNRLWVYNGTNWRYVFLSI